jgi:hypothetical protein
MYQQHPITIITTRIALDYTMPALLFRYEEFFCFCCGGVGAGTSSSWIISEAKFYLRQNHSILLYA